MPGCVIVFVLYLSVVNSLKLPMLVHTVSFFLDPTCFGFLSIVDYFQQAVGDGENIPVRINLQLSFFASQKYLPCLFAGITVHLVHPLHVIDNVVYPLGNEELIIGIA